jgi:hypothetical protein
VQGRAQFAQTTAQLQALAGLIDQTRQQLKAGSGVQGSGSRANPPRR